MNMVDSRVVQKFIERIFRINYSAAYFLEIWASRTGSTYPSLAKPACRHAEVVRCALSVVAAWWRENGARVRWGGVFRGHFRSLC